MCSSDLFDLMLPVGHAITVPLFIWSSTSHLLIIYSLSLRFLDVPTPAHDDTLAYRTLSGPLPFIFVGLAPTPDPRMEYWLFFFNCAHCI